MSDLQKAWDKMTKAAEVGAKKLSEALDRAFETIFDKIDASYDKKDGIDPKPAECFEDENPKVYFLIQSKKTGKFIQGRSNKRNILTDDKNAAMRFTDEAIAEKWAKAEGLDIKQYKLFKI